MVASNKSKKRPHARQALVLATVAQVWEACLHHCCDEDAGLLVWCLDVSRDWALGRASEQQVEAASRAHVGQATTAPSRQLMETRRAAITTATELVKAVLARSDEEADQCFFLVGYFAMELGASTEVNRLGEPETWSPAVESNQGLIVAGGYLWRPDEPGGWGGRFVARAELTAEELVALDELLEQA
jgi:hypothetical protein